VTDSAWSTSCARSTRTGARRLRSTEWAHAELEFVVIGGPEPGRAHGIPGMAQRMREFLTAWEGYRIEAEEYRQLDDERVLVVIHRSARQDQRIGAGTDRLEGSPLFHLRGGKVTRLVVYFDRQHVLADLGLTAELRPRDRLGQRGPRAIDFGPTAGAHSSRRRGLRDRRPFGRGRGSRRRLAPGNSSRFPYRGRLGDHPGGVIG
jgi:hypothetical protein